MRRAPQPKVRDWLLQHASTQGYLSVVTLGEISQGIVRAAPQRQAVLEAWHQRLKLDFADRILPLSGEVMETWGQITGQALLQGRPLAPIDAMLAATAMHYRLTLVTLNTRHFLAIPVSIFDPSQSAK